MGELIKVQEGFLETSNWYAEAYSYRTASIMPIIMYRLIHESANVYHIANVETCPLRYIAEMIYLVISKEKKEKIAIRCEEEDSDIEFSLDDSVIDIYNKLTYLDKIYFWKNSIK